jgi:hypothetical protein
MESSCNYSLAMLGLHKYLLLSTYYRLGLTESMVVYAPLADGSLTPGMELGLIG